MKGMERFFRYIGILTPSDENSQDHPSSACEFNLAHELVKELQALGVSDAFVDENRIRTHSPNAGEGGSAGNRTDCSHGYGIGFLRCRAEPSDY